LHHGDIRSFIATQQDVDLIHAALVLHHLNDDENAAVLADLRRVIRPGGAFGWTWQWLWQGRHRAEAVALLTPA
jgi:trans-aconitate methyltransferase